MARGTVVVLPAPGGAWDRQGTQSHQQHHASERENGSRSSLKRKQNANRWSHNGARSRQLLQACGSLTALTQCLSPCSPLAAIWPLVACSHCQLCIAEDMEGVNTTLHGTTWHSTAQYRPHSMVQRGRAEPGHTCRTRQLLLSRPCRTSWITALGDDKENHSTMRPDRYSCSSRQRMVCGLNMMEPAHSAADCKAATSAQQ